MFDAKTTKLGISPINWINDNLPEFGEEISFEQCIKEMAAAGYCGCEIGNKYPRDPATLHAALKPFQLQIAGAWCSTYFIEPNRELETITAFTQFMNFLKAMGAKFINVVECGHCTQGTNLPILKNKPIINAAQWRALTKGLEELGRIAKDNSMQIVYHYHMGTCVQTQEEINHLMQETDPELVSLLLNTGHLYFAGGDILKLIQDHGKRIKYVHLNDIRSDILQQIKNRDLCFSDAVKAGVFTVPGDGCLDFTPIFSELSKFNYTGWFMVVAEQDPVRANPLEYAKKSRAYIKNIIGV